VPPSRPPNFGSPRLAFHRIDGGSCGSIRFTAAVALWRKMAPIGPVAGLDREIARLQRANAILKNTAPETPPAPEPTFSQIG
jgi:hypothetical protein